MAQLADLEAIEKKLRETATAQVRAMSTEDLELHVIGLTEMLKASLAECERRSLQWTPAKGSA